jgi:molybdopterin molybdotransferase
MDGYAVRGKDVIGAAWDTPVTLEVVGETRAGAVAGRALTKGEAVRIMVGAPIPPGSDSVIRVEHTDAEEVPGQVNVFSDSDVGQNIRPGGQDMQEGEEMLPAGTSLGAGQVGLLAACGADGVWVHRKPRVAILSTGDELAPVEEFHRVLSGKSIPETNAPSLAAAVSLAGGIPLSVGIARDTREDILEKIAAAQEGGADALLTSGGASMGEKDLLKRVLTEVGLEVDFWRVKMRPGTPFSFSLLPGQDSGPLPVFGLPGNPASTFVCFQVFCRPYILRLAGHTRIHRPVIQAKAGETMKSPAHLTHFYRVTLEGDPASHTAFLTGSQSSGLVRNQGLAQGLAVVPEGEEKVVEGEEVRVVLLDDLGLGGVEAGYLS